MGDYHVVSRNVRFAHNFCPEEVEARWLALLFHPIYSQDAGARLAKLPKASDQVPWTEAEEEILRGFILRHVEVDFQEVLESFRSQFHSTRTARSLQAHADILKRVRRLGTDDFLTAPHPSSPLPSLFTPQTSRVPYFPIQGLEAAEIEERGAQGSGLPYPLVEYVEYQAPQDLKRLKVSYLRKAMRDKEEMERIELLMNRSAHWGDAFALLRGSHSRSYLHKQSVTLGRATTSFSPDIDLSLEGYAKGISRSHARITLRSRSGRFEIENTGKTSFYVNGQPVSPSSRCSLVHFSFLEVRKRSPLPSCRPTH
jgi:hypothetical protein